MAWTAPRVWVSGELVSASIMNTYISDNDSYLKTEADNATRQLFNDEVQRANSGTGETTLSTYPMPAGKLTVDGQRLWVAFGGTLGNNTNVKTIKLKIGAIPTTLSLLDGSAITGGQPWRAIAEIVRTSATGVKMNGLLIAGSNTSGNLTSDASYTSGSETWANALDVITTGQSDTASSDVVQEVFSVGWSHPPA